jgi:pimeloyl-ACP methyl ester carboxylesterase
MKGRSYHFNVIIGGIVVVILHSSALLGERANHDLPGIYGKIVEVRNDLVKDGIVERIKLYPKAELGSNKRIVRNGILMRYKNAKATVLICHGFMCDKHDVGLLRRLFPRSQYNIMTFDFRAHGDNSKGQYCTFGRDEAFDVIAAASFLKNHPDLKNKPLFVYGFSMGASSAIEAQAKIAIQENKQLFDGMILDCPFDSSEKAIKRALNNIKMSIFGYQFDLPGRQFLEKYAFHPYVQSFIKAMFKAVANFDTHNIQINLQSVQPYLSAKKISAPCFFIHCKQDEKIPVEAVKTIYNNVSGPKKLWLTNGRRHFDSYFYNPEKYTERVRAFLADALKGKIKKASVSEIIEDSDEDNLHELQAN